MSQQTKRASLMTSTMEAEAEVLPFPLARRRDLIAGIVRNASQKDHKRAEAHLQRSIQVQRETMERRGIAPELIARQAAALEAAVRAAYWGVIFGTGANRA